MEAENAVAGYDYPAVQKSVNEILNRHIFWTARTDAESVRADFLTPVSVLTD